MQDKKQRPAAMALSKVSEFSYSSINIFSTPHQSNYYSYPHLVNVLQSSRYIVLDVDQTDHRQPTIVRPNPRMRFGSVLPATITLLSIEFEILHRLPECKMFRKEDRPGIYTTIFHNKFPASFVNAEKCAPETWQAGQWTRNDLLTLDVLNREVTASYHMCQLSLYAEFLGDNPNGQHSF